MNNVWDSILQWLHSVGLHPNREAVEQAGTAVLNSASDVATTVGQAASGMDVAS